MQPSHPIHSLDAETRDQLEQLAGECADLFQRSSSCVEGRNGFLALYQHGHHRLSPRKQQVLTALQQLLDHAPGWHDRRAALLPPTASASVRAGARAHAVAGPTGVTTSAASEAAVSRPCGGLATADQGMIKADTFTKTLNLHTDAITNSFLGRHNSGLVEGLKKLKPSNVAAMFG
jgi:hypothetical protein